MTASCIRCGSKGDNAQAYCHICGGVIQLDDNDDTPGREGDGDGGGVE